VSSPKVVLDGSGVKPRILLTINQAGVVVQIKLEPKHARKLLERLTLAIEAQNLASNRVSAEPRDAA